ncbi:aminopeptidase 2 [Penicillium lagena]|uniref:aminopeptidase 2 n=1 Tax=Penicillium lagena TaxID=94218 RepID=UPI00253FC060|nr:aminopeptidase 2 [Penicillium lagena]KAJ5604668.1 aminopeptidase 2 [Penicillium lagena]
MALPTTVGIGLRDVVPKHYDLKLEPDLENAVFHGTVKISIDILQKTSVIPLNVNDLNILRTEVRSMPGSSTAAFDHTVSYDAEEHLAIISVAFPLEAASQIQLVFVFEGRLNDQMMGFYLSRYLDSDGLPKVLATSQLEATEARRVFPCFDEPSLKASFSVTLVVDRHLTCLSNMDIVEQRDIELVTDDELSRRSPLKKIVTFNRTPRMSTYLLAFVVAELQYVESTNFHVPVRVYMPRRQNATLDHGHFSLNLAMKTLEFYERKFNIEYPLPKLDMIAIPDFPAGAMENWGLITFREADLLFDEDLGSMSNKLRTTLTVQHEIAHQWFGNLVTMDQWDGLWLKEGFATWMSWYACDHFYPEWKVWEKFVADSLQEALSLDSLPSSHPLELPTQKTNAIGYAFDAISYLKGCSLVRMVYSYLGEDEFMNGVRRYLNQHAYGNASTADLWAALGHPNRGDFVDSMSVWTTQVGYPVVTVTVSEGCICLQQDRHVQLQKLSSIPRSENYPVPLNIRSDQGVLRGELFNEKSVQIRMHGFLKLNADQSGIYRTSYDAEHLQRLVKVCTESDTFSVEDRLGIIADTGALATSGHQKTSVFLRLLMEFIHESQPTVWIVISRHLDAIQSAWLFEDPQVVAGLKTFARQLVSPKLTELGREKDYTGHLEKELQALLFGIAGQAGDQEVIATAKALFTGWVNKTSKIDPNLLPHIFRLVLEHGGLSEYEIILKEYMNAKTSIERNTALRSLGYAKDTTLVTRTLELAASEHVRDQDLHFVISSLQAHRTGVETLWKWLMQNWTTLARRLTKVALGKLVKACITGFATRRQKESIKDFFDTQDTKGIEIPLTQALEVINVKSLWVERDRHEVALFIKGLAH